MSLKQTENKPNTIVTEEVNPQGIPINSNEKREAVEGNEGVESVELSDTQQKAQEIISEFPQLLEGEATKEEVAEHVEYMIDAFGRRQPALDYKYLPHALGLLAVENPEAPDELHELNNAVGSAESVEEAKVAQDALEEYKQQEEFKMYEKQKAQFYEFDSYDVGQKINSIRETYWKNYFFDHGGRDSEKELEKSVPDGLREYVKHSADFVPGGKEGREIQAELDELGYKHGKIDRREMSKRIRLGEEIVSDPSLAHLHKYVYEREPTPIPMGEEGEAIKAQLAEHGYTFNVPGNFTLPVYEEASHMTDASQMPEGFRRLIQENPAMPAKSLRKFVSEGMEIDLGSRRDNRFFDLFLENLNQQVLRQSGSTVIEQRKVNALWYLFDRDIAHPKDVIEDDNTFVVADIKEEVLAEHIKAYIQIKQAQDIERILAKTDREYDKLSAQISNSQSVSMEDQMKNPNLKEETFNALQAFEAEREAIIKDQGRLNRDLAKIRDDELYKEYTKPGNRTVIEALGYRFMPHIMRKLPIGQKRIEEELAKIKVQQEQALQARGAAEGWGEAFGDYYKGLELVEENLLESGKEKEAFSTAITFATRIDERYEEFYGQAETAENNTAKYSIDSDEVVKGWVMVAKTAARLLTDATSSLKQIEKIKQASTESNQEENEKNKIIEAMDAYGDLIKRQIIESSELREDIKRIKSFVKSVK